MRFPWVRGALLFAAGGWAVSEIRLEMETARFEAARRSGDPARVVELADSPLPAARVLRARALTEDVFPPALAEARADLVAALGADPLDAKLWFALAENRALSGDRAGARAALARSDALDPHYPRGRLDSIGLWAALGEPERGLDAARRLGALGGRTRLAAARRLRETGFAPARIFEAFGAEGWSAVERLDLGEAVPPATLAESEALARFFDPATGFDATEERDRAAGLFASPPNAERMLALWKAEQGAAGMGWMDGMDGMDGMDAGLEAPPFRDFRLGWQPPAPPLEAVWTPPRDGSRYGSLELPLERGWAKRGEVRWVFQRFPLLAGRGGRVVVRVRQSPRTTAPMRIAARIARAGDSANARPETETETETVRADSTALDDAWEEIALDLPAAEGPGLVELALVVLPPRGGTGGEACTIGIGGLRVETTAAEGGAEATHGNGPNDTRRANPG